MSNLKWLLSPLLTAVFFQDKVCLCGLALALQYKNDLPQTYDLLCISCWDCEALCQMFFHLNPDYAQSLSYISCNASSRAFLSAKCHFVCFQLKGPYTPKLADCTELWNVSASTEFEPHKHLWSWTESHKFLFLDSFLLCALGGRWSQTAFTAEFLCSWLINMAEKVYCVFKYFDFSQ